MKIDAYAFIDRFVDYAINAVLAAFVGFIWWRDGPVWGIAVMTFYLLNAADHVVRKCIK